MKIIITLFFLYLPILAYAAEAKSKERVFIHRPPTPTTEAKASEIALQSKSFEYDAGQYQLKAKVDGHELEFLFDTGAKYTQLMDSDMLGHYRINGFIITTGLRGARQRLNTISIDRLLLDQTTQIAQRVAKGNNLKANLLGMKSLRNLCFSINSAKAKLQLATDECKNGATKPFAKFSEDLISVDVKIGEQSYPMIFDTGASITVLDQSLQLPDTPVQVSKDQVQITDSAGIRRPSHVFRLKSLQIGDTTFDNVTFMSANLDLIQNNKDPKVFGIIGYNVINQALWHFDLVAQKYGLVKN